MTELNEVTLCQVICDTLRHASKSESLSKPVTPESSMGNPIEWDSLSFVSVFLAVGKAFDIELDDDDAIHFQSVRGILDFLSEGLEE